MVIFACLVGLFIFMVLVILYVPALTLTVSPAATLLARTYCMEAQGEVVEPQLELSVPLVATYQTLAAFAGGAEKTKKPEVIIINDAKNFMTFPL